MMTLKVTKSKNNKYININEKINYVYKINDGVFFLVSH